MESKLSDAKLSVEQEPGGGPFSVAAAAGLWRGLLGFGAVRLAALGAVGVAVFGLIALFAVAGPTRPNALLYADLELREADQITTALDRAHIPWDIQGQGSRIMVPPDQVARARMLLARDGLPSGGTVGYELFDRTDPLTSTQFQQSLNETRALEGELARSIRTISGVRAARVHLVLPRRDPFEHSARAAQASVLLTTAGAARLDREAVQAIINLVAAAVPGLKPETISVVDSKGTLLARAGHATDSMRAAETIEELRRGAEARIARGVEDLLEQTVGIGHVRAEASVELDTATLRQTEERFDPDQQVARSTQNVTDSAHNTETPQNVSVQNNLPNADATGTTAGSQTSRQEETTNYEIGKTTRVLTRDTPQLKRVSVAVMLDDATAPQADGGAPQPRSAEDLARLTALVKTAIGYDEQRGDHVELVSMHFNAAVEAPPVSAGPLGLERTDIPHLLSNLLLAVIAILALLLVVRPVAMSLSAGRATSLPEGGSGGLLDGQEGRAGRLGASAHPALGGAMAGGGELPAGGEDLLVEMSNVEGQVRASSIRRTAQLAERHPEETLGILRAWMAQPEPG